VCEDKSYRIYTVLYVNFVYITRNTNTAAVSRFEVMSEETNVDGYVIRIGYCTK